MKRKPKKLNLAKETLRHLNADTLEEVAGGYTPACPDTVSCNSCTCTQLANDSCQTICYTQCPCTSIC